MAKKDKKGKKSQGPGAAADALRDAVERTFQAGAGGAGVAQKRAAELFDDLSAAMLRLREAVDERRVLETIEQIRDEVQGLAGRVAALERSDVTGAAGAAAATATSAPRRATGGRSTGTRSTATRSAGTRSTGTRSGPSRSTSSSTARKAS